MNKLEWVGDVIVSLYRGDDGLVMLVHESLVDGSDKVGSPAIWTDDIKSAISNLDALLSKTIETL